MARNSKAVTRRDIALYSTNVRTALGILKYYLDTHDWEEVERTAHDVASYAGEVENLAEAYARQESEAE